MSNQTEAPVQTTRTSACPHPEAVGKRWGDPISEERQGELQGYLDRWATETDHGERRGPFDSAAQDAGDLVRFRLSGADVSWLAVQSGSDEYERVPNLHLEGASLYQAHLEGAILREAHLEGADLAEASLVEAHLEGTDLREAFLKGTDLREAFLDTGTDLHFTILRGVRVADTRWGGVNLAASALVFPPLGDESAAYNWKPAPVAHGEGHLPLSMRLLGEKALLYFGALRANRQLAVALRDQGLNELADRFGYRAHVLQRRVLRLQGRYGPFVGSLFLDLISGYGYRPVRSLIAYVLVILGFAATYFALGGGNGQAVTWNEAIVISMTAFHGRGFFSAVFQPGDLQAAVAAVEAFIGLLIEIVLIATFTQRFFAR
jgi:hypothetical protein